MSSGLWLPGLVILAGGLAAGLLLALRLRARGDSELQERQLRDLQLVIRDLEERRDDLYRRLRESGDDDLASEEYRKLEQAAAHTLLELDRAIARLPRKERAERKRTDKRRRPTVVGAAAAEPPAEPAPPPAPAPRTEGGFAARHPLLAGFVFGAGMVAVIGLLIIWAVMDAKPKEQQPRPPAPAASDEAPHQTGTADPEIAARVADLEGRLAADPEDLLSRKELALLRLSSGQFFEAFSDAEQILAGRPQDPDGLYIQGVVRLTMGQNEPAIQLLDRVLAQYPQHLQALIYRGLAFYQSGRPEQAIDTWEIGLEIAGGSHPDFEELLAMARSGAPPPSSAGNPAAAPAPRSGEPGSVTTSPAGLEPPEAAPRDSYALRLELGADLEAERFTALFVFLRTGSGPPAAARRISDPRFPLDLVIGPDDSMMGGELPDSGVLVARLDEDGSASTTGDRDLTAETEATKGSPARLVLSR